jgi:hypothetical protein
VLIRDVMGFSGQESADMLATSVPSVNSALHRARGAVAGRIPEWRQQCTLRSLGDRGLHDLVDRYARAVPGCERWHGEAQPALGWDAGSTAYLPFALNVLSLRGELVSDVTAFIVRAIGARSPDAYIRFPDQPMNARQLAGRFERFGLPGQLN